MPEIFNFDGPEVKTHEDIATITKSMSEYKDVRVTRDDLYEEAATNVPSDFEVKYSINSIGDKEPFLVVKSGGKEQKVEGQGRSGLNPNDFKHRLGISMGDLMIEAGFKEERDEANPNVKSGLGRVVISKKIDSK
jgi:hypothetical protein